MSMLLPKLKRWGTRLGAWCPGYLPLVRRVRGREFAVVMYHGVTATPLPVFNWCQLDRMAFARQIEFLTRHTTILPLREVVQSLERGTPLPRHTAVLTFDDGYRNVLTEAAPILEQYAAPATVFLVTSLLDNGQPPWTQRLYHALVHTTQPQLEFQGCCWPLTGWRERGRACQELASCLKRLPDDRKEECLGLLLDQLGEAGTVPADSPLATLSWAEVEQLGRSGLIDFGAHTHTHPILARCSLDRQEDELRRSRDLIRERLGRCDLLAYPNGSRTDFTEETRDLAVRLGYRCALTTEAGLNRATADRFTLRRVAVGADTPHAHFACMMAGL